MKNISTALQTHLTQDLTYLVEIIKITRTDGIVKAFTNHDGDLLVEDIVYKADGSFSSGKMDQTTQMKTNNYDIEGLLESSEIAAEDIRKGLYDHARIDVALVNWRSPEQGAIKLRRGWLGEVVWKSGSYVASLRGMKDLLQRRVGDIYTPECRHDLGCAACSVNLGDLKETGSVTFVSSKSEFRDTSRTEAKDFFAYGKLTWRTGANAGQSMEVQAFDDSTQTVSLWLPAIEEIEIGDAYDITPGCNKRFDTCKSKFDNVLNFGGFPHLPGLSKILQYPESS